MTAIFYTKDHLVKNIELNVSPVECLVIERALMAFYENEDYNALDRACALAIIETIQSDRKIIEVNDLA